jgi:hypothetical protein
VDNIKESIGSNIESAEVDATIEETILLESFIPNCILISGCPDDLSVDDILKSLLSAYETLDVSGSLFWINNADFYCTLVERNHQSDDDILLKGVCELLREMSMLVKSIQICQIVRNSHIRFSNDTILNVKKRTVGPLRWQKHELGWLNNAKFKNQGIEIRPGVKYENSLI